MTNKNNFISKSRNVNNYQ